MERIYFSISKFINYIKENKPFKSYIEPENVSLWFESDQTFTNKYKQVVIKPIAITLRNKEKSLTLIHQTLINAFNNKQICISFNENKNRTVPKIKNGELAFLSIEMTQKEFEGKEYYPSRTGFTTNKALVKNILAKKLEEETEEEDYGFNCTQFV